ncbi:unnamed protein product [Protopolystoma xenopodis]|uniref:TRC8-like N-terminal domain-containing protein n=1 Tax=Protopolystoma xenopodis TaxID=117903 RepID=A0A3S5ATU7_9PLAT|nr:unnamed protein product [Protopolystoma xenopodis]
MCISLVLFLVDLVRHRKDPMPVGGRALRRFIFGPKRTQLTSGGDSRTEALPASSGVGFGTGMFAMGQTGDLSYAHLLLLLPAVCYALQPEGMGSARMSIGVKGDRLKYLLCDESARFLAILVILPLWNLLLQHDYPTQGTYIYRQLGKARIMLLIHLTLSVCVTSQQMYNAFQLAITELHPRLTRNLIYLLLGVTISASLNGITSIIPITWCCLLAETIGIVLVGLSRTRQEVDYDKIQLPDDGPTEVTIYTQLPRRLTWHLVYLILSPAPYQLMLAAQQSGMQGAWKRILACAIVCNWGRSVAYYLISQRLYPLAQINATRSTISPFVLFSKEMASNITTLNELPEGLIIPKEIKEPNMTDFSTEEITINNDLFILTGVLLGPVIVGAAISAVSLASQMYLDITKVALQLLNYMYDGLDELVVLVVLSVTVSLFHMQAFLYILNRQEEVLKYLWRLLNQCGNKYHFFYIAYLATPLLAPFIVNFGAASAIIGWVVSAAANILVYSINEILDNQIIEAEVRRVFCIFMVVQVISCVMNSNISSMLVPWMQLSILIEDVKTKMLWLRVWSQFPAERFVEGLTSLVSLTNSYLGAENGKSH